jgi:hypothetical protein
LAEEPNEPKKLNEHSAEACPDPERSEGEGTQALKAELEAEKQKAPQLVEEATKPLLERITALETDLAAKMGELNELKELNKLAVEDYRKLVLQTNPLFTPDIIVGDNIEELKSSIEKAELLVAKIKTQIQSKSESESESSRVPAGAPARGQISTEGLSAKEKINLGLEEARKRKES